MNNANETLQTSSVNDLDQISKEIFSFAFAFPAIPASELTVASEKLICVKLGQSSFGKSKTPINRKRIPLSGESDPRGDVDVVVLMALVCVVGVESQHGDRCIRFPN
jgi:hypothetical protein